MANPNDNSANEVPNFQGPPTIKGSHEYYKIPGQDKDQWSEYLRGKKAANVSQPTHKKEGLVEKVGDEIKADFSKLEGLFPGNRADNSSKRGNPYYKDPNESESNWHEYLQGAQRADKQ